MISKNQLKQIRALGQKKQRKLSQTFLVQGEKNVIELLNSDLEPLQLFASSDFIKQHHALLQQQQARPNARFQYIEADEDSLTKASTLSSNSAAIAIATIPKPLPPANKGLILALDGISDPGNLGTIIRLADWYGVSQVLCSQDCADPYSPKTISATMGAFTRVTINQLELPQYLKETELPVYGAYLSGENIHQSLFPRDLILVMGSESQGIREELANFITDKVTIPSFGESESLNVGVATGIILDNIKRTL